MKANLPLLVLTSLTSLVLASSGTQTGLRVNNNNEVILADFETFDDVYYFRTVVSNYNTVGSFCQSAKDDVNNIEGRSLDFYIEGTACSNWVDYTTYAGFPAVLYFDIWSNSKLNNAGFSANNLTSFSVDLFNPNDYSMDVVCFNLSKNYFPIGNASISVKPHSKATLQMLLNKYYMQNELQEKISFISFCVDYDKTLLDNGELYYQPSHLYFDNLRCTIDKTSVKDEKGFIKIPKVLKDDTEILSFDDPNDANYMYTFGSDYAKESDNEWNTRTWFMGYGSGYSFNSNKKYVPEGHTGSLKWSLNPTFLYKFTDSAYRFLTDRGLYDSTLWTSLTVCPDYLNWYNFSFLNTNEYKIQIDVYNDCPFDKEVGFGIHGKAGLSKTIMYDLPFNYGAEVTSDVFTKIPSNSWKTLEITDFSTLDMSEGLGRLRLVTHLIDVHQEMSFYCSNLRIVRK